MDLLVSLGGEIWGLVSFLMLISEISSSNPAEDDFFFARLLIHVVSIHALLWLEGSLSFFTSFLTRL